jgi:hypothetical protein
MFDFDFLSTVPLPSHPLGHQLQQQSELRSVPLLLLFFVLWSCGCEKKNRRGDDAAEGKTQIQKCGVYTRHRLLSRHTSAAVAFGFRCAHSRNFLTLPLRLVPRHIRIHTHPQRQRTPRRLPDAKQRSSARHGDRSWLPAASVPLRTRIITAMIRIRTARHQTAVAAIQMASRNPLDRRFRVLNQSNLVEPKHLFPMCL